jgi:hypothetical protein
LVALLAVGSVLAANPSKEKIALTAAGKAHARTEVVRRADLGAGWSGGFKKPDLSSTMPCPNYRPKQSDLVLIGVAETSWRKQPFEIDSEAQVLRTAAMVRRDWQRTVLAPQVVPCLRTGFAKALGSKGKLVSFGRVAFPHLATYTRAFRVVAKIKTPLGSIPVEIEFLLLGTGRNELTLTLTGPKAARATLARTEARLGRLLAHRARR